MLFKRKHADNSDRFLLGVDELVSKELMKLREKIRDMKDNYRTLANELMQRASQYPSIPCNNPSGIIVLDTETTGLNWEDDELLQISIIDGDGNTLINEYVKPYWTDQWEEAQKVNGITEEMVKEAPYPHELIPKVKGIFESAKLCIAYNGPFDVGMLVKWNIDFKSLSCEWYDVMVKFAPIYGQWSESRNDFKWQKLTTCADYFGYEGNGKFHDSLEDVRATLYCYYQMQELDEDWVKSKYQRTDNTEAKVKVVEHDDRTIE